MAARLVKLAVIGLSASAMSPMRKPTVVTQADNGRRYRRHQDVATEVAGSELLLVHLAQGAAFRLNPTGRAIWELATEGLTAVEIGRRLQAAMGGSPEQIQQDTGTLIEELEQHGLLERQPEADG